MKLPLLKEVIVESGIWGSGQTGTAGTAPVPPGKFGSGGPKSMPSQFPSVPSDAASRDEIQGALEKYASKLRQKGIKIGKNVRELGKGHMGVAYDLGPKVLKVTTDRAEANACTRIKGKQLKNVYQIFDVFELDSLGVYVIHQEKLKPMPQTVKNEWGIMQTLIGQRNDTGIDSPEDLVERLQEYFAQFRKSKAPELLVKAVFDMYNGMAELDANGIKFLDYHSGNVMMRGKDFVIIDLGVSRSGEKPIDKID